MRTAEIKLHFSIDDESGDIQTNGIPKTLIIEKLQVLVKGLSKQVVEEATVEVPPDGLERYLDAQIRIDRANLRILLLNDKKQKP